MQDQIWHLIFIKAAAAYSFNSGLAHILGGQVAMALYRAHFMTHGNDVFGVANFEAEDDEAAKAHANNVLRTSFSKGHEIWEGSRLVHTETYS